MSHGYSYIQQIFLVHLYPCYHRNNRIKEMWSLSLLLFSFSVVSDSLRHHAPAHQASLSFTLSRNLLKLMSIEWVMLSNHLILCCPLFLLPSIFPSIRVFPNESGFQIKWPKYWNFGFSISLSNEYSGLASFRIDWFDLLAVQKTLLKCHL